MMQKATYTQLKMLKCFFPAPKHSFSSLFQHQTGEPKATALSPFHPQHYQTPLADPLPGIV